MNRVLITGAARGIGAATACRLHAAGAAVALVDVDRSALDALADRLGSRCAVFVADVSDQVAIGDAVDAAAQAFGGLDVVIANAGVLHVGTAAEMSGRQLDQTIMVNLLGACYTDRAALVHLERSRGYLLNIASLAAAAHMPLMGAYAASKAGLEAYTDSLRIECRDRGVAVGCGYFGFVDTTLVRDGLDTPAGAAAHRIAPLGLGTPIDVASTVDAIERAIVKRSERFSAPTFVALALRARWLGQRATELALRIRPARLRHAVELARSSEPGYRPIAGDDHPTR